MDIPKRKRETVKTITMAAMEFVSMQEHDKKYFDWTYKMAMALGEIEKQAIRYHRRLSASTLNAISNAAVGLSGAFLDEAAKRITQTQEGENQ